jgi:hypothetical protein
MGFLVKIWRRAGFGYEGKADKLRAIKDKASPDQVLLWFAASNLFGVHHQRTEAKSVRAINRAVSNELTLRVHEARIQAYSARDQQKVSAHFNYAGDSRVYYKIADIVDAIVGVCCDLKARQDPMAERYMGTAVKMLKSPDSLKDACYSIAAPPHIVDDYYQNISDVFSVDRGHHLNVEAATNQFINRIRLKK